MRHERNLSRTPQTRNITHSQRCWHVLATICLSLLLGACSSSQKTVLILGDSLSAGYGLNPGESWVNLLENRAKAEKINAKIVNAGISGDTTDGGKARLPLLLIQHRPSIVVIELGGNDGLRGQSLDKAEANLRSMISNAKTAGAKVLLVGMKVPSHNGQDYADRFAAMYGRIASDTKVALVPFMLEGLVDQPQLFMSDGIHPTAEAQPIILTNIWQHLKPLLK